MILECEVIVAQFILIVLDEVGEVAVILKVKVNAAKSNRERRPFVFYIFDR